MAQTIIEIDTQQLERDKRAVAETLGAVRSSLRTVYAGMDELDAMWDGSANEAFKQQFNSDRQYFEEVCKELEQFITSLEYAQTEYNKCDAAVGAAVAAIRI